MKAIAAMLALLSLTAAARGAPDTVPNTDAANFAAAKAQLAATLKSIRSIEMKFNVDVNGAVEVHRYASTDNKFYEANIKYPKPGVVATPDEFAWDGTIASTHRVGLASLSMDRSKLPPLLTPADNALMFVNEALELAPSTMGHHFVFLSARQVNFNSHPCFELAFREDRYRTTTTIELARDSGGWPISLVMLDDQKRTINQLHDVVLTAFNVAGRSLVYPTHSETISSELSEKVGTDEQPQWSTTVVRFDVDLKTIHVNQPIDETRFRVTPWPCDEVLDLRTKPAKHLRPADPSWRPKAAEVGFPFDVYLSQARDVNDLFPNLKPVDSNGRTLVASDGKHLLAGVPQRPRESFLTSPWPYLSLGVALLIGGIVWRIQMRRGTR